MKARTPNNKIGDAEAADTKLEATNGVEARAPLTPTDAVDENEIRAIEQLLGDEQLSGGQIRLERKGPSDTNYQYCVTIQVADGLDLDLIKRVWGGGDYKARTFRSNGQMYKPFKFSIDYRIQGSMDTRPKSEKENGSTTQDLVQLAQVFKANDSGSSSLMAKMMEQAAASNQSTMQMMMMMMQQSQQQSAAMMTAMATAMGGKQGGSGVELLIPVLTAMINRPAPTGADNRTSLVEMVTAMRELKELAAPGSVPPVNEEKEESMLDKLIKYGGPVVAALITKQPIQMPGAGPVPESHQLPAPQGDGSAVVEQQLPPEFKAYINMIISAANKNADSGTYADLIADNLDTTQAVILTDILQKPDWIEKLAETDKRVLNFRPWFTNLRGQILEIYGVTEQLNQSDAGSNASEGTSSGITVKPVISIPGAAPTGGAAGYPVNP